jgi:hypothetical protein
MYGCGRSTSPRSAERRWRALSLAWSQHDMPTGVLRMRPCPKREGSIRKTEPMAIGASEQHCYRLQTSRRRQVRRRSHERPTGPDCLPACVLSVYGLNCVAFAALPPMEMTGGSTTSQSRMLLPSLRYLLLPRWRAGDDLISLARSTWQCKTGRVKAEKERRRMTARDACPIYLSTILKEDSYWSHPRPFNRGFLVILCTWSVASFDRQFTYASRWILLLLGRHIHFIFWTTSNVLKG